MATNQARWVKSLFGPHITEPLIVPGNFAAGTSVPIKRGEILELTGNTNTEWVPLDSDFNMAANVAIAAEEIKAGDPTGYYKIIVPRPGDVFEYALDAADDLAIGTALYFSVDSEHVTDTAGTNILGNVCGWTHYSNIYPNNHAESGAATKGVTLAFQSRVHMTFQPSNSYWAAIQTL